MRPHVASVPLLLLASLASAAVLPRDDDSLVGVVVRCLKDKSLLVTCLQERAVRAWDEAISSNEPLQMMDGVISFEKSANDTRALAETSPEDLPSDPGARSFKLNDMLWSRISQFMQTRTLKLSLPLDAEGRGKLKKYAEPLAMAVMWKAMMAALAMGALALLAGKALLVSKLALTLSTILAMRRLLGANGMGMEKIDIYAKHYTDKKHDAGASYLHPSVAEPDGYYGHKRSFQPLPAGAAEMAFLGSAPALDVNNNVYHDDDFAQIKAGGGRRRGVDIGAVIRKNLHGLVQRLDKDSSKEKKSD